MKHSAAYRVWHSFLCACGALILLANIAGTASLRYYMRTDAPVQGLADSRLSDAKIPFTGKTVAGLVRENLVPDALISEKDVAAAIDAMQIPQYVASKLGTHFAMLRGDADTRAEVTESEVVDLLERNRTALYQSCLLVIEDSDLQQLREAVHKPLEQLDRYSVAAYGSPAGRMIARFRASWYHVLLDIFLLLLLCWRWVVVRTSCGASGTGAVRKLGRLMLIPGIGVFLWVAISELASLFVRDGIIGLHPLTHALRIPHWGISAAIAAAGFLLLLGTRFFEVQMARYIQKHSPAPAEPAAQKEQKSIPEQPAAPAVQPEPVPALPEPVFPAEEPAAPVSAAPEPLPAETPAPDERPCVSCGKPLKSTVVYCIYCGTNQKTGNNAIDEMLDNNTFPVDADDAVLSAPLPDTAPAVDLTKPGSTENADET